MANPNDYQYSKITGYGMIRLIQLEPSQDLQAPIKCSLVHATLAHYRNSLFEYYIALSYVWGDLRLNSAISVNSKRFLITASLDTALRHIRDFQNTVYIWADGVCINQKDVEDRNIQVSQMGLIYQTAQHTIIFLGPSSPFCENVLDDMRPRESTMKVHTSEEGSGADRDSAVFGGVSWEEVLDKHILNRPWFSRTWIFQELILSHDPWIQIGRTRIRWFYFSRRILSVPEAEWTENFKLLGNMMDTRNNVSQGPVSRLRDNPAKTLLSLLSSRRGLGVTDARDIIFAHLGMIDIPSKTLGYQYQLIDPTKVYGQEIMVVDYNKTVVQVYEDTARFILQNIRHISFLNHIEAMEQDGRREGLPSWVPDWTRKWDSVLRVSNWNRKRDSAPKAPSWLPFPTREFRDPQLENKCKILFPVRGVLAVSGEYYGTVKVLLRESTLPNTRKSKLPPVWAQQITHYGVPNEELQNHNAASQLESASSADEDYNLEAFLNNQTFCANEGTRGSVSSENKRPTSGHSTASGLGWTSDAHLVEWILHSPDHASEILGILLEYYIEMTRQFKETHANSILNKFLLKPFESDTGTVELKFILEPLMSQWVCEFSEEELLTIGETGLPREELVNTLSQILAQSLRDILDVFSFPQFSIEGSIAITSCGIYEPVPPKTRINDILCKIHPEYMATHFILRPENETGYEATDAAVWKELSDHQKNGLPGSEEYDEPEKYLEIKHCQFIRGFTPPDEFTRSVFFSRDFDEDSRVIFALH